MGSRIVNQLEQGFVERGIGAVLAHDPGRGLADLEIRDWRPRAITCGYQRDDILTVRNALAQLHESVLDVARLGAIGKVGVEVGIAELAAEPGVVPKEKGKQDQGEGEERDQ